MGIYRLLHEFRLVVSSNPSSTSRRRISILGEVWGGGLNNTQEFEKSTKVYIFVYTRGYFTRAKTRSIYDVHAVIFWTDIEIHQRTTLLVKSDGSWFFIFVCHYSFFQDELHIWLRMSETYILRKIKVPTPHTNYIYQSVQSNFYIINFEKWTNHNSCFKVSNFIYVNTDLSCNWNLKQLLINTRSIFYQYHTRLISYSSSAASQRD